MHSYRCMHVSRLIFNKRKALRVVLWKCTNTHKNVFVFTSTNVRPVMLHWKNIQHNASLLFFSFLISCNLFFSSFTFRRSAKLWQIYKGCKCWKRQTFIIMNNKYMWIIEWFRFTRCNHHTLTHSYMRTHIYTLIKRGFIPFAEHRHRMRGNHEDISYTLTSIPKCEKQIWIKV